MGKRRNISARLSIQSLLDTLPPENDNNFTIKLRDIVLDKELFNMETDLEEYLNKDSSPKRFAAFYALLIICRELNNYSKYNNYVDTYSDQFTQYDLYTIVMSTFYRNKAILGEKRSYGQAISWAKKACEKLPNNIAVKHHFAEIVVLAIEESESVISCGLIEEALDKIDDVIAVYPSHAKYYSTQGRLFAAKGDFAAGISCVKKALDLEVASDKDALIRIGEYNYYLLQIKMMMETKKVDKKIGSFNSSFNELQHNLDNTKTQYLEYLAFFSSILAFILTTVNIVAKIDDFNKGAGVILIFAGVLIIVFDIFRILLYYSSAIKLGILKLVFCFIVGLLLIMCGLFIGDQAYINLFTINK